MIVRIGLVELQHRELGVVLRADALVAEVAVDLVDPIQPADDQSLEIKLRRDAQKQIHIQRVVVGRERPRGRTAGYLLHHRGFHFEISAVVEELPQRLERLGTLDEDFSGFEVGEQIHITLAVAQLHIGEAVKLLREREHGFGEKGQAFHVYRQFSRSGAEEVAGGADVVAEVEQLVKRKALLAHRVEADVDLQPLASLLKGREAGLALCADGHDAAGDRDGGAVGLEVFRLRLAPRGANVRNAVRGRELVGIGGLAELLNFY